MYEDISTCFVSKGVGWVGFTWGGGVGIVITGLRSVSIEDGGFDHDSQVGESNAAEVGPFVAHVVVADANEPASLAAESVLQREAGAAAVTLVGEVGGVPTVSDGDVIKPLILGEFGARDGMGRVP